jgi:hypothetical protein
MALDYPECVGGLALIGTLTHLQERAPTPFRALDIQSNWRRKIVARMIATPAAFRRARKRSRLCSANVIGCVGRCHRNGD